MLERLALFPMVPLQILFHLMTFIFSGEEIRKVEETRKFLNPIVSRGMESPDRDDRDKGKTRYLSTKDL